MLQSQLTKVRFTPSIQFTPDAWERFQCLIRSSRTEISGFGTVEQTDYGFLVTNIFLLEQAGNSAETLIDPLAQGKFLDEFIESGGNPEDIRLWWHTHGLASVFWSKVDDDTMEQLLTNHYMLGIVGNADGDCLARVDIDVPQLPGGRLSLDQIAIGVDYSHSVHLETVQQEIRQKVRRLVPPSNKKPRSIMVPTAEISDEEVMDDRVGYDAYDAYDDPATRFLAANGYREPVVINFPN